MKHSSSHRGGGSGHKPSGHQGGTKSPGAASGSGSRSASSGPGGGQSKDRFLHQGNIGTHNAMRAPKERT